METEEMPVWGEVTMAPKEPTKEMLDEAYVLFDLTPLRAGEIYKAMIRAFSAQRMRKSHPNAMESTGT